VISPPETTVVLFITGDETFIENTYANETSSVTIQEFYHQDIPEEVSASPRRLIRYVVCTRMTCSCPN